MYRQYLSLICGFSFHSLWCLDDQKLFNELENTFVVSAVFGLTAEILSYPVLYYLLKVLQFFGV